MASEVKRPPIEELQKQIRSTNTAYLHSLCDYALDLERRLHIAETSLVDTQVSDDLRRYKNRCEDLERRLEATIRAKVTGVFDNREDVAFEEGKAAVVNLLSVRAGFEVEDHEVLEAIRGLKREKDGG